MELSRVARTRAKNSKQKHALHLQSAVLNLLHRYHNADGAVLAAMLSLTCVLIVPWAISMR
jgi:hypothetical protein